MKFIRIALLLLIPVIWSACHKDGSPNPTPNNGERINFANLQVGQTSRYLGLNGNGYASVEDIFDYSDDTLNLVITGHDNQGYLVKESLDYQGDLNPWLVPDKDSVYQYYLNARNDTLRITPRNGNFVFSRIFAYLINKQGIPLQSITQQKLAIGGWKTDLPYCECRQIGYAENYMLFGTAYTRLNIIVENSDMALDGNGETYMFSPEAGIVRASTYSWWTQNGIGWDLLPQN